MPKMHINHAWRRALVERNIGTALSVGSDVALHPRVTAYCEDDGSVTVKREGLFTAKRHSPAARLTRALPRMTQIRKMETEELWPDFCSLLSHCRNRPSATLLWELTLRPCFVALSELTLRPASVSQLAPFGPIPDVTLHDAISFCRVQVLNSNRFPVSAKGGAGEQNQASTTSRITAESIFPEHETHRV